MSGMVAESDSEDLQALFDSVARENPLNAQLAAPKPAGSPKRIVAAKAAPKAKAKSKRKGKAKSEVEVEVEGQAPPDGSVMRRIGNLTRTLHDALRELGYDGFLEKTAASIPDVRDRLNYVVKMTEQAAVRALNATEAAQPIQDKLGADAERLSGQWQKLFDKQLSVEEFKVLVSGTRDYLADVPKQTSATNAQLLEIIIAQDFQDLTGQVIKKITRLAQDMEHQLVHLLVDLVPENVRQELDAGLLNGPVVKSAPGSELVTDQNQVDDLLASLGF